MTRILLYTGKGGVGKTSVAAATALHCADRGLRTIILSTDIAHSPGRRLRRSSSDPSRGDRPEPVGTGVGASSTTSPSTGARSRPTQPACCAGAAWTTCMAEEMTVLPGMDEVGSLLWIAEHHDSGDYDVVVVDAAPTGETLRLLSLPEAARWWMEKIEPIGRRISQADRPAHPAGGRHADARRRRVRRRRGAVPQAGAHARPADRPGPRHRSGWCSPWSRWSSRRRSAPSPTSTCTAIRPTWSSPTAILPEEVGQYFRGWYEAQQRYGPMVGADLLARSRCATRRSSIARWLACRCCASSAWRCTPRPIRPATTITGGRTRWSRDDGEFVLIGGAAVRGQGGDQRCPGTRTRS